MVIQILKILRLRLVSASDVNSCHFLSYFCCWRIQQRIVLVRLTVNNDCIHNRLLEFPKHLWRLSNALKLTRFMLICIDPTKCLPDFHQFETLTKHKEMKFSEFKGHSWHVVTIKQIILNLSVLYFPLNNNKSFCIYKSDYWKISNIRCLSRSLPEIWRSRQSQYCQTTSCHKMDLARTPRMCCSARSN